MEENHGEGEDFCGFMEENHVDICYSGIHAVLTSAP